MSGLAVLNLRKRRAPARSSIDFRRCGMCGAELSHENLTGHHVGTIFVAKGYYCFSCGFQDGARIGGKTSKRAAVLFDWRRIVATRGSDQFTIEGSA